MTQSAAERLIADALQHGDLIGVRIASVDDEDQPDPWTLPPVSEASGQANQGSSPPQPSRSSVLTLVFVEKTALPPEMLNRLLRIAAFQNPEFYKAQAMRLSTFDKPRYRLRRRLSPRHLALPRGCLTEILSFPRRAWRQAQVCVTSAPCRQTD